MKALAVAAGVLAVSAVRREQALTYGPAGCVSLSRSSAGSCVLATSCQGLDLSRFEFAFNCEGLGDGEVVRHSFGYGGFDPAEEFDTEVRCGRCSLPSPPDAPAVAAGRPAGAAPGPTVAAVAQAPSWWSSAGEAPEHWNESSSVRYGPQGCVSTYKSKEAHCIMQTNCSHVDIRKYAFGLVCVDKVGVPVRHLFGTGSFDPEETFDTLITCDQCWGLEDIPTEVAVNSQVIQLSSEIRNLKKLMASVSGDVEKLSSAVFSPNAPAPAPIAAPSAQSGNLLQRQQQKLRPRWKDRAQEGSSEEDAATPQADVYPHAKELHRHSHLRHRTILRRRGAGVEAAGARHSDGAATDRRSLRERPPSQDADSQAEVIDEDQSQAVDRVADNSRLRKRSVAQYAGSQEEAIDEDSSQAVDSASVDDDQSGYAPDDGEGTDAGSGAAAQDDSNPDDDSEGPQGDGDFGDGFND